jgi:hypothetical protein
MTSMHLKPHTILINYAIDLCSGKKRSYSQLDKLDYTVQTMEHEINTLKGFTIKPDVIKISKKCKHVLLIECKGGTIDENQINRYKTTTIDDLNKSLDPDHEQNEFDICILCNSDPLSSNIDLPILVYIDNTIHKINRFKLSSLDQIFKEDIDLSHKVPSLSYYPFSINDDNNIILVKILQGMVSYYFKKRLNKNASLEMTFTSDDFLPTLHPLWNIFSKEHKKELKNRIKKLLNLYLNNNHNLSMHIKKLPEGKYKINPSFTEKCYEILNNVPKTIPTMEDYLE